MVEGAVPRFYFDVREGAALNDNPDTVECGPGTDTVFVDANDSRFDCEILNPK